MKCVHDWAVPAAMSIERSTDGADNNAGAPVGGISRHVAAAIAVAALVVCAAAGPQALASLISRPPDTSLAATPAPREPASAPAVLKPVDIAAIHRAVQGQLDAFAADDGDTAFGLSSRDTRSRFGNPENFLRAVRKYYPPIYRHRRVQFSSPELVDGDAIQLINLTDSVNHVWVAVYRLERDADGAWKIDGCQLHPTSGISI